MAQFRRGALWRFIAADTTFSGRVLPTFRPDAYLNPRDARAAVEFYKRAFAAEEVARTRTDRYLGCLAYFWCENTPSFAVHPQVVPYVTTDRGQFYNEVYKQADFTLMGRWGKSGVRAFGLWEYGYGPSFIVPRVPVRAMVEAVRAGHRHGARGYFMDATPQWGFDAFKVWAVTQLLWEPTRTFEELTEDFFGGYYGAAAKPMRAFFERCEARWMAQTGAPYWLKLYQQEDQALLFPAESCRELRALLDDAVSLAAGDDVAVLVLVYVIGCGIEGVR